MNYLKKQTTYICKAEKLGSDMKPIFQDVKNQPKGGPIIDFIVENPNLVAPPTDSYEGTEVGVNIRYYYILILFYYFFLFFY